MGVHDRLNIGTHAIDQQVHADFAGHVAAAGDLLAVQVNDDHVGARMAPLLTQVGVTRMRSPVKPHREIAVHGGHEAALVQHASVTDDFFPMICVR